MFTHQEDVIYGRKYGMALTLDVFRPLQPNGIGVLYLVVGGWYSNHDHIGGVQNSFIWPLLERGYTVFAVITSSAPRFTIPEVVKDVHRAVRFVRYTAADYAIDPDRLGVYGLSAGGHLSLLVGYTGNAGTPDAEDPVERTSSEVQAVAQFYGPTDFFNYGNSEATAWGDGILADYRAPFDFHEFDPEEKVFVRVQDQDLKDKIGESISPIFHIDANSPPTLAIHGDADLLVPLQQSEILCQKLEEAGVVNRLIIKEGGDHGWEDMLPEMTAIADWFDTHLGPLEI